MNRKTVSAEVAKAIGFQPNETEAVLVAILETIKKEIRKGNRVEFRGFGSFIPKTIKAGKTNLPHVDGLKYPKRKSVKFKPSKLYFR